VSRGGKHVCATVKAKGVRKCRLCGARLRNTGWERYSPRCARCAKQAWRNLERRQRKALRQQFGGKCSRCGYDRCESALHFHHKDGTGEKYLWNVKGKRGASIREIKAHPERFALLCANCHIETHCAQRA
jgi:hypothetical protein